MDSHNENLQRSLGEYQYQHLKQARSIRLLDVHASLHRETPIRVSLRAETLDNPVPYEAVSYSWAAEDGDSSLSGSVEVDGALIRVTSNCEAAIRRLRDESSARCLWIDAVCIDQSSIDEKRRQVPMMGEIYSKAQQVLLWIGESSLELDPASGRPYTDIGIEFIRQIGTEANQTLESTWSVGHYQGLLRKAVRADRGSRAITAALKGVAQVFYRRWWTRLWAIQEVAVAQSATLICGEAKADFSNVEAFLDCLSHPSTELDETIGILGIASTYVTARSAIQDEIQRQRSAHPRQSEFWRPGCKALWILELGRRNTATDPRDKIFGLLGLFENTHSENVLPAVDYKASEAEIYANVARAVIVHCGNLDIICDCSGTSSISDLPSWAPDWTLKDFNNFKPSTFRAAKDSVTMCTDAGSGKLLRIKGFVVTSLQCLAEAAKISRTNPGLYDLERVRVWRKWIQFSISSDCPHSDEYIKDILRRSLCWGNSLLFERLGYAEYTESFEAWYGHLTSADSLEGIRDRMLSDDLVRPFVRRIRSATLEKTLGLTLDSQFALVPDTSQPGDKIAIFTGGSVPFVIRATGERYVFLGPCYMDSIMDGEAFPSSEDQLQWMTLQ